MVDVPQPPAPIVPDIGDGVDTSIDSEAPALLSPEQLDRYISTVTALLTAAGLEVTTPDRDDPAHLEVALPRGRFTVELDIREDRSTEWNLTGSDELPEDTSTRQLTVLVTTLLNTPAQ